jgi:hypothetical protein
LHNGLFPLPYLFPYLCDHSLEACSSRFATAFLLSLVTSGGRLFDCSGSCPGITRDKFFYATYMGFESIVGARTKKTYGNAIEP